MIERITWTRLSLSLVSQIKWATSHSNALSARHWNTLHVLRTFCQFWLLTLSFSYFCRDNINYKKKWYKVDFIGLLKHLWKNLAQTYKTTIEDSWSVLAGAWGGDKLFVIMCGLLWTISCSHPDLLFSFCTNKLFHACSALRGCGSSVGRARDSW